MKCKICGKDDDQKPMAFRGEPYCCDLHRKQLEGDVPGPEVEKETVE